MKKITLLLLLSLTVTFGYSQNKKTKKMLSEIEGKWQIDDNGNVTYTKIIENLDLSKDEIYVRALAYFTYNYGDGTSVVQVQEKDKGLIIGKGLYANAHIGYSLVTYSFDTWHILRIDIKENRVRILLTLTKYKYTVTGGDTPPNITDVNISDSFPLNPKGYTKNQFGKAFYKSHLRAQESLLAIEKSIKEGNTIDKNTDGW
tara:strand:+ start:244 stop:849 length:606 start_codon:yes stop_codon:yes gene_type:complete